MPSEKKSFNLSLINWLSILIMSSAGIVAVYLHNKKNSPTPEKTISPESSSSTSENTVPITYANDISRITEQCKNMVSNQNSFAIFEHGTCVLLAEPVQDPSESAISSLKILTSPELGFEVKLLKNNNYLIVFNEYLFYWFFAKDIADMKEAINTDSRLDSLSTDPESIKKLPDFDRRLGKLARLLLLEDSKTLVIKKILRAKPTPPPSQP